MCGLVPMPLELGGERQATLEEGVTMEEPRAAALAHAECCLVVNSIRLGLLWRQSEAQHSGSRCLDWPGYLHPRNYEDGLKKNRLGGRCTKHYGRGA